MNVWGEYQRGISKRFARIIEALKHWQFCLRAVVSLALFTWVLILGYSEGIFHELHRLPPYVLLLCVSAYCLLQILSAINWWLIASATGVRIRPLDAIAAFFVGMFFNLFLPGIVGGDVVRSYIAARLSNNQPLSRVMGTVYAQRSVGFVSMIAIGCIATLWLSKATQKLVLLTLAVFLTALLLLSSIVSALLIWRNSEGIWQRRLARFGEGAFAFLGHPRHAILAFTIAIVYHICLDAMLCLLGWATGMRMSYAVYVAMISFLTAISSLPIAIHGLGLREITAAHIWVLMGAPKEVAILWSLLWRIVTWLAALPGGLVYIALAASAIRMPKLIWVKAQRETREINGR